MQTLLISGCGNQKADQPSPVRELYRGPYTRGCLRWCERTAATLDGAVVFLLSARHGLVRPDEVLSPYETRWGDPECVTYPELYRQVKHYDIQDIPDVRFIGAKQYFRRIRRLWPHAVEVFPPNKGIKCQLVWLRENTP